MAYEDDEEDYDDTDYEEPEYTDDSEQEQEPLPAAPSEEDTWQPYEEPQAEAEPDVKLPGQYAAADIGTVSDAQPQAADTWKPYEEPKAPPDGTFYDPLSGAPSAKPKTLSDLVTSGAETDTWKPYTAPDESPWWAAGREFLHGLGPAAVGTATGIATGAAVGTATGLPVIGTIGGGIIGGLIGGYAAETAQEAGAKALGIPDDAAIRAANREAYPKATAAGGGASMVAGGAPGILRGGVTAATRAISAGIGGAWETGVQLYHGTPIKEALPQIAATTVGGAVFAKPYGYGRTAERIGASVGERISGGRAAPEVYGPPEYQGPPEPYGPRAPVDRPAAYEPDQGRLPFGMGIPQQPPEAPVRMTQQDWARQADLAERWERLTPQERNEYAALSEKEAAAAAPQDRAGIGGGERQPELPLERPGEPPAPVERGLTLEPPGVDQQGQYGFNIEAPRGVGVPRTTYAEGKFTTEQTSRPSMPETGGVARESAPPPAGDQPMSSTRYSKEAPTAEPGSGINILQPGQADPTLRGGLQARTAEAPRPEPAAPTRFGGQFAKEPPPTGKAPAGVRESTPAIDEAVVRATAPEPAAPAAPPARARNLGEELKARAAAEQAARAEAAPLDRPLASRLLNQPRTLRTEAAKRGMTPEALKAQAQDIVRGRPAEPAAPARPVKAAPVEPVAPVEKPPAKPAAATAAEDLTIPDFLRRVAKDERGGGRLPKRRDVVRGRSGRPIESGRLPIGTEGRILEAGYKKATGPKDYPKEIEDIVSKYMRKEATAAEVQKAFKDRGWTVDLRRGRYDVEAFDPSGRHHYIQGAERQGPAAKGQVKTFNGAVFTGATVHEAAVFAKNAGYKPHQIFEMGGEQYRPPGARAAEAPKAAPAAEAAAAPPAGGGKPPGGTTTPTGPAPLGGGPRTGPGTSTAAPPKFAKLRRLVRSYQETFQPETINENALKADAVFAKYAASKAGEHDRIIREGLGREAKWRKEGPEAGIEFMKAVEERRPVKPEHEADAKIYRKMLDEADAMEKQWGSKAGYRDDYFPHIWERPKPGQVPINQFIESLGPTWFQKARTIDLIEQGIAAGYKLKHTNPEAVIRERLISGADMRMRMELLNDLKNMNLAARFGSNETPNAALSRMGWQKINAPDRQAWMISPDVATLWKNGVQAHGLWAAENLAGDAFRSWMGFKNVWVPVKLALSAFHPLHVMHINMAHNLARAVDQAMEGKFGAAFKSMASVGNLNPAKGKMGREQWLLGENARTPEGKLAAKMMEEGGFSPMLSEQLRIDAGKKFAEAVQGMSPIKGTYHGIRLAIQKVQAPIFETWIPRLKTAAFLNDAAALLERRPELNNDPVQRRVALRAIGKSVDNRFGEMFYGGLFWNRYVKDAGIGSFLSLGWNLGFAREFGGAAIEAASRPLGKAIAPSETRQNIRDSTNKIKFASIYMGTAALIGGAMTWAFTGKPPQETSDYIFPKVGGENPDGSPRRLTTMFYLREIPMFMKHAQEHGGGVGGVLAGGKDMILNKMLFQPFKELYDNRSYYGKEIWDTNAPGYQQAMQAAKHVFGEQTSPMSVTGAKRSQETGGSAREIPLAFLGFGPAPKYAEASAMQNRIGYLYREHVAPGSRAYEDEAKSQAQLKARTDIMVARQRDDDDALGKAITAAVDAGLTKNYIKGLMQGVGGDQKMFKQLPASDQIHLLNSATKDEVERYFPHAKKETKIKWYEAHP